MNDREFAYLKSVILKELGFDAESYRTTQMRRRLTGFVQRWAQGNVGLLCKRLRSDDHLREELLRLLTINVSEFFRDPLQFELIREVVLPDLLAARPGVRIWSAGCAGGEEPYTLAIICDSIGIGPSAEILGTDIDPDALARAQAGGPYPAAHLRKAHPAVRERYFEETPGGYYLRDPVRRRVRFARHDLITDRMTHQFDLIACRNVTIYFTSEVKARLIRSFHGCLRPGGYLFIGGAESLLGPESEGFSRVAGNFYQRKTVLQGRPALGAQVAPGPR